MSRYTTMMRSIFEIAAIVGISLCARGVLADHYVVPTGSMEPTVHVGDRIVVDKRAYGLRIPGTQVYAWRWAEPRAGEVVVLDSPNDDRVLLKRVVAHAGTEVMVRQGKLTLDGVPQAVDAGRERLGTVVHEVRFEPDGGPDFGPIDVPAGQTLVMGDNRGRSDDGRSFGFVADNAILGRAVATYWREGSLAWSRPDATPVP